MAPVHLSAEQILSLRLRAQGLLDRARFRPAEIVKAVCAVQSQDPAAGALSIWARGAGFSAADIERARLEERSLVRTWVFRGTLHLLATEDAGWLLGLLGRVFIPANRARRAELGLDEATCERGLDLIREILAGQGALARAVLGERLAERGLVLAGQALPHLIGLAALKGLVCLGPDRGNHSTCVLLEDWVSLGPALPREEALVHLARRYLAAYGPASPADLAHWSGLPQSELRAAWGALAPERLEVSFNGELLSLLKDHTGWLDDIDPSQMGARLLPAYDTSLLGYRKRDWVVDARYSKRINAGGGIIHPTVLVESRAAGTWRTRRKRDALEVILTPYDKFPGASLAELESETSSLGRFLGVPAILKIE